MSFPIRKVQFHPSALIYLAMATMQLFGLFLKTRISNVFQVFPPERNFLWDSLLCFGHSNTLRSLIIANVRTVTMENFPENHVAQIWSLTRKQLINAMFHMCFVIVYYYIFSSFKCFELSYCSSTDFDGFGSTCEQLNIPLVP